MKSALKARFPLLGSICAIVAGIGLIVLSGWGLRLSPPASFGPGMIPAAGSTSALLVGLFISPPFPNGSAFAAFGTVLFTFIGRQVWPFIGRGGSPARGTYAFILILIILSAGVITTGYFFYTRYENNYKIEVESRLSAVADLKVDEIMHWRQERLSDASLFYRNDNFYARVRSYFKTPDDADARAKLRTWLVKLQATSQYDRVFLLDSRGIVRMSLPEELGPISAHLTLRAGDMLRTKEPIFEDFYRDEDDGRIYLAVLVPVIDGGNESRAIGALIMNIDPEKYLYPFIKRWPTLSRTAETLLVRREGNDVLFLNDLKFEKGSALNLRSSLARKEMPAVQAALGRRGTMEGRDYRGVAVIADVRPVPDSPWFMTTHMDISEVYEPLKERLWVLVGFVVVLLFGAGSSMGLIWRRQREEYYRIQHETETRYTAERARLLDTLEKSLSEIYIFDAGTLKFLYVNDGARRNLGYTLEEIKSLTPVDLKQEFSEESFRALIRPLVLGEKEKLQFYTSHKRADGSFYPVEVHLQLIGGEGETMFLAVIIDITERQQAQEALKNSEEKYRKLVDNAPVGIYKSSLDGRLLYVNKAFATMLEFITPEEMMSEDVILRYKNPEDRTALLDRLKKNGRVDNFELDILSKSGKIMNILLSATLEGDATSGMVLNVTEQKKLQTQLRHSQKMEAIGTLAGGIAHDFNNILNVIMGYGLMVLDNMEPDSPLKEHMSEVLAAADRAASLTKRLLIFSREQDVKMRPVNVNEIILGIEKMLSRIIGEDIIFATELTGKRMIIMADSCQIEQILMNLASNARDAMPKGGRLTISTRIKEVDDGYIAAYGYGNTGAYALITVRDTGSGIDAETQKKIFEPFFTTKGIGEGTGLGLAIAYAIIKQHNGYIKVYSEEGEGTSFKIFLPLIDEETLKRREIESESAIKGGTETILMAEDDAALRRLSRIVLESFGYNVITADNGEDAITKYMENRDNIQLIILDMIMPKKSGKEVYDEIRKLAPVVKTLFVSGYTMDIVSRRELLDQDLDFILKPVSPKDLLKKVRELLDR